MSVNLDPKAPHPADRTTRLRVGLIGCGKMGVHHLKAIAATGVSSVVGIADPATTADDLGATLPPDARVYGDAAEMLADARPDIVHIVTPPATHVALALLAIDAGCHVYVEKPFTATAAEARRVLDAAHARGVTVCAGHQVLFEAPALAVWKALGTIGRLVHVESYFSFKMVRRTITPVDQVKDILPHAVYPLVDQLRTGTGNAADPIDVVGISVGADGNAYALLRLGETTGIVLVTLTGRPVEQYQSIVGTNGSLRPDYIGGGMAALVGPGTGPGVLLTPYRRAFRALGGTTRGIVRLLRGGSYPGLREIVRRFHVSVQDKTEPPVSGASILDTVSVCETIGVELDRVERVHEDSAALRLTAAEAALPPLDPSKGTVLVTGGTGLLGRRIVQELRRHGFPVRAIARRIPPYSRRAAGVEYVAGDLARGVDPSLLNGVGLVVHAAAETAGGQSEHRRNSVDASRQLVEAAARAGIRRFIHVSSLAILKSSREVGRPLDESVPVDAGNLARGPYVWGKAESEVLVQDRGRVLGVDVKVIRPGPLVDYEAFQPPGRLGREVGPVFVAIGPRRGPLSVCDVSTAAAVIRHYATDFEQAPVTLNLVEAPAPARRELLARFLVGRSDLSTVWVPFVLLRLMSGPLRLLQRMVLGSKSPVDVAAAFASERYETSLAARVIQRARSGQVSQP